jgi:hypothetical protein
MIDTNNAIRKGDSNPEQRKERPIKKHDMVKVEGTGRGRYIKKGQKLDLHRVHAEDLVAKGAVKIVGTVDPEKAKIRTRKGNG